MCGMVDLLGSVGGRVDRDSPAKFHKFNIVSMGSRTNLSDFVLWFTFGRSYGPEIFTVQNCGLVGTIA